MEGEMTIFGGNSKRPCFILTMDKEDAILQSIESGRDCSLDEGATSKHTVLAAAKLAKERGATRILFTDNSTKHLPTGYFRLSNMYFLTTGKTWYESILPCQLVSLQDQSKYRVWKTRAETNMWADVYACLQKVCPGIDIDIGETEGQAAMHVLHRLKDSKTDFFAKYEAELLMCSSIGSLHGLDWEIRI